MPDADLAALETALAHSFSNQQTLVRALTHRSYSYESSTAGNEDAGQNERLEFLGDAVLGFLVSEALLKRFPDSPEGVLSRWKAQLVNSTHLHQVALRLGLGRFLLVGRSEEMSGGRGKRALLADATEALIAALYLDGGLDVARRFVETLVLDGLTGTVEPPANHLYDYKGALQELAQAHRLPQPRYQLAGYTGPDHQREFRMEAVVGPYRAEGAGYSKKVASQRAAKVLLEKLRGELTDGMPRSA